MNTEIVIIRNINLLIFYIVVQKIVNLFLKMLLIIKRFILFLILFTIVPGQVNFRGHKFLHMVIPSGDTVRTGLSSYRVAGNTHSDFRILINGEALRVFSSGAFAKLLELDPGENRFVISAISGNEIVDQQIIVFIRENSLSEKKQNKIEVISPKEERWLTLGDTISLSCLAEPGCQLTVPGIFDFPLTSEINNPLKYTGQMKVTGTSIPFDDYPEFILEDADGRIRKLKSENKLRIFPRETVGLGITTGFRGQYSFSPETDRLGLTNLNYIPPDIPLNITGKTGEYLRFKIGKDESGWINERYVDLFPDQKYPELDENTPDFNFNGEECDTIIISAGSAAPFITYQSIDPAIIVVKVVGLQTPDYRIVKSPDDGTNIAHFYNKSENKLEIYISLGTKQIWGYSVDYTSSGLRIIYRKRSYNFKFSDLTIVLDPGHGGTNFGALGATGVLEKEINLDLANKIKVLLELAGVKVYLLRETDTNLYNSQKLRKLFENGGDILLSLHCNSIGYNVNPFAAGGTALYYLHPSNRKLAEILHKKMLELGFGSYGIFEGFNLSMNSMSELPAVLIETGFLSNPNDESKLIKDSFRYRMAEKIVEGLKDFVDWSKK